MFLDVDEVDGLKQHQLQVFRKGCHRDDAKAKNWNELVRDANK